jgi:hypothetical protein
MGMGFVRYGQVLGALRAVHRVEPASPLAPRPQPSPEDRFKPPQIKLGIAASTADTLTWLGYEKPTQHAAPRSTTEQSAMAIAEPGPRNAVPGRVEPTPPLPVEAARREQVRQSAQVAAGAIAAARQRLAQVSEELTRRLVAAEQAAKVPPLEPPKPEAAPAATVQSGGGGGTPGPRANKESNAVSIKDAPTVRPGQVVAAQGLEIRTVEPRWSTTTLMTLRPRNPTVLITFWKDGKVKEVQWVREGERVCDTGSTEVNQPLLAALYAWTATGKPLDELDPKDPGASVTIMMTVILVG